MPTRIPFTKILHNPTKPEILLANGNHFLTLNSNTGQLDRTYPEDAETLQQFTDSFKSLTYNTDGSLLATVSDNKELRVWNTNDWSLKATRPVNHRVNAIQFTHSDIEVVVADKFGDVYCHPIEDSSTIDQLSPIVGHVSMLTDMILLPNDKFVITADRDEHIRVSRFPNGYNIESFCLGHTDVITCIRLLPWSTDILASTGGDGTIRLWDYLNATEIQCLDIRMYIEKHVLPAESGNVEDPMAVKMAFDQQSKSLAVLFARTPALVILTWDGAQKRFVYKETLQFEAPALDATFDLDGKLWVSIAPSAEDVDLLVVFRPNGQKFERVASSDSLLEQVTSVKTGLVDSIPDMFSTFGRKYVASSDNTTDATDLKENLSKKRKT